jgi:creatinine amidohydrolase
MPWLHEMKWPAVESYLKSDDRILMPVGSTEQHGRHAPLGTDTLIAIRLSEDASARSGVPVTPPLYFGWSPHHLALPGSISIRPSVLQDLLYDVASSLAEHGFRRFLVVNGHRVANLPWIQIAAEAIQRELGLRVAIFDPAYMQRDIADDLGFGPLGHAEELESSQMMHLYPDLIDLNQAIDHVESERKLYKVDPRLTGDSLVYVPSTRAHMAQVAEASGGVTGQPSRSNAEAGKALHEHLVARIVEVLDEVL